MEVWNTTIKHITDHCKATHGVAQFAVGMPVLAEETSSGAAAEECGCEGGWALNFDDGMDDAQWDDDFEKNASSNNRGSIHSVVATIGASSHHRHDASYSFVVAIGDKSADIPGFLRRAEAELAEFRRGKRIYLTPLRTLLPVRSANLDNQMDLPERANNMGM